MVITAVCNLCRVLTASGKGRAIWEVSELAVGVESGREVRPVEFRAHAVGSRAGSGNKGPGLPSGGTGAAFLKTGADMRL